MMLWILFSLGIVVQGHAAGNGSTPLPNPLCLTKGFCIGTEPPKSEEVRAALGPGAAYREPKNISYCYQSKDGKIFYRFVQSLPVSATSIDRVYITARALCPKVAKSDRINNSFEELNLSIGDTKQKVIARLGEPGRSEKLSGKIATSGYSIDSNLGDEFIAYSAGVLGELGLTIYLTRGIVTAFLIFVGP